jgi:hypothetical protein
LLNNYFISKNPPAIKKKFMKIWQFMRKTKVSKIQNFMELNEYLNMPFLPSRYFQFGWSWAFRFYCKMGLILMKPWQASLNKAPGKGRTKREDPSPSQRLYFLCSSL